MFLGIYRRVTVVCLAMVLAALAGCGSFAPRKQALTDEDRAYLTQRVEKRWQTLVARDFEKTWEFSTPTYRSFFSKSMFANQFSYAADWQLTSVEILNYDAGAAVASVAVRVMSKPTKQTAVSADFGAIPVTFREQWILVDGEWWFSANA